KAPEDWRTPKPGGASDGSWKAPFRFLRTHWDHEPDCEAEPPPRQAGRKRLSASSDLLRCGHMLRFIGCLFLFALPGAAAERHFDFSGARLNEPPPGFRSTVSGNGAPGEWKIV